MMVRSLEVWIIHDSDSENCAEPRCHVWSRPVRADDWPVLRAMDDDGAWKVNCVVMAAYSILVATPLTLLTI